jgi:methylglutaconyl-CoA hydratase
MNAAMIAELTEVAGRLGEASDVRVVVLRGRGDSFCAGGDLGWMRDQMAATPDQRAQEAGKLAWMLLALNRLPKPLIGAIHGNAFGGGVGIASVCDIAIGHPHVQMGLTEVRLGLIPATIGPYVAARIGEGNARRVVLSGRRFDALTAQSFGLLAQLHDGAAFDQAIAQEVDAHLAAAPGAVAAAKALMRDLGQKIDEDTVHMTIAALKAQWESPEAEAGIGAFFERRPPPWRG